MNKKVLLILPILLLTIFLTSCNRNQTNVFQSFVQAIYDSEEALAGYRERSVIVDGDFDIYSKDVEFKVQRGEKVKSQVNIVEKKLSTSGLNTYDETITSYKTVDNVKYTEVNGIEYQNEYTIPTYYLTFVMSEDFLEQGYSLTKANDDYLLTGKVLDNKVSSLFLNKSLQSVTNLNIEVAINSGKLKSFKADYVSTTGFNVELETNYYYGEVGQGKAEFYLEGGSCQNSKEKISYLYNFDGTVLDTKIVDPNTLYDEVQDQIVRNGYHIEGWYQTKTVNEQTGEVEYSDKWDFENDTMSIDGVKLYAYWKLNRVYTYELYYINEEGEEIFLDKDQVNEGDKFDDYFLENKEVEGYTSLGYLDENGDPWDSDFIHPGGDEDLAIKVYLDLIEGEYTVVRTAKQFNSAIRNNENIYLMNNIDFDEDEIDFDSYSGLIEGNGYSISNFEIDYNATKSGLQTELGNPDSAAEYVYVSLFFELKDATIRNIKFEEFVVDINVRFNMVKHIIVSPLATTASNTKLENVVLDGTMKITRMPEDCELVVVEDDYWYSTSENVLVDENSSVSFK